MDSTDQFLLRSISVKTIDSQHSGPVLVHIFGMVC